MKWALVGVGVVVALILVIVVVGAVLPRDHIAAMSARIMAPPDTVWATLTDPARFPSWRSDVASIELLPPAPTGPSWREHSKNGKITMVIDVAEKPRRIVTRIADQDVPFGGTWECLIEPDGTAASKVTIVERGSVYNPVFRFVSRFVMGHTATIETYLRALGQHFGTDPIPVIISVPGGARGV